jgi:hypothetical protein
MKTTLRLAAALAALTLVLPAAAQEQRPTLGIGASINPEAAFSPTVEIYVPIRLGQQFRLEPSVGIFTRDRDAPGVDTSDVTVGIGAFYMMPIAAAADVYVGGRLKLNFASRDDGVNDDSDTDLTVAAALGGEYYLVPQLSLGVEAQLGLYQLGDVSGDDSGFFTTGLGFLRFYF